jgi:hypothetical protein
VKKYSEYQKEGTSKHAACLLIDKDNICLAFLVMASSGQTQDRYKTKELFCI